MAAKVSEDNHLSDELRKAVSQALEDGYTRYAIAKKAGINWFLLNQWYDEGKNMRIDTASKVARVFGMRLTKPKRLKKPTN